MRKVTMLILAAVSLVVLAVIYVRAQTLHGIQFSWTESDPTAVSFNLYCSTTSNGQAAPATATGITSSPYLWTGGTPGTAYYCKLTALNSLGEESLMSNQSGPTTFPGPPQAPSSFTAVQK